MNPGIKEYLIKPSILDAVSKLELDHEFIRFSTPGSHMPAVMFRSGEITGFRFGVKWIRGYWFTIGRIYCIDVRNTVNQEIRIRLKSIYRIRVHSLNKKYSEIVNSLYAQYFFPA